MGSHILDILRQGIWASLTGGWFYDPHLGLFSNTFHLYVWLFLLSFPLILHLTLPPTFVIWLLYCIAIGVLFIIVKFFNYKLHHMFDTEEVIEEGVQNKNGSANVDVGSQGQPEAIELDNMNNGNKETSDIKKDSHSHKLVDNDHVRPSTEMGVKRRRSRREGERIQSVDTKSKRAPLAEMDKDDIDVLQGAVGGISKSLAHCHSNTDQEDDDTVSDIDDDLSIPNTITTKADVEVEPSDCHMSLQDDSIQQELKSPTESKHSCDADLSDVSPEHVYPKIKKARKKPQRAKSALESSDLPSTHSSEKSLQPRPSLPARPKLHSVINKDTGVSIIRPWSDQTISRTKEMLESDEITVIDFAAMSNVAKNFRIRDTSVSDKTGAKLTDSIDESAEKEVVRWERTIQDDEDSMKNGKFEERTVETPRHVKSSHKSENETVFSPGQGEVLEKGGSGSAIDKSGSHEHMGKKSNKIRKERTKQRTRKAISEERQQSYPGKKPECKERKAVSEDRQLDVDIDDSLVISASEPIIKIGYSGLHSSSDESDLSLGEVVVDCESKAQKPWKHKTDNENASTRDKPKCKVKTRAQSDRIRKDRPNSFEYLQKKDTSKLHPTNDTKAKIQSSPTLATAECVVNPQKAKPKDIGFTRVTKMLARAASDSCKRSSNDWNAPVSASQQSSTVGLDWLFSTDSDSSDTRSHIEHDEDSITSSGVSLEDNMFDDSVEYVMAKCHDNIAEVPESETCTSTSSPSTDELEIMRKQGAIPKHFHKPLPPVPEPSPPKEASFKSLLNGKKDCTIPNLNDPNEEALNFVGKAENADTPDTKASSPASFDLSDPEEFHRKLLEILNEPAETSKEQLKKFMAAVEAKKNKSSSVKSKDEKQGKEPVAGGSKDESTKVSAHDELDTKSNESKPVTPTEISTLLPDDEEPEARVVKRLARKPVRKRRVRSQRNRSPTVPALGANSHLAENHDDTTEGATHLFQDEDGNWFSYTFGDNGLGVAVAVNDSPESKKPIGEDRWSSSSCASGSMVMLDFLKMKDDEKQSAGPLVLDSFHDLCATGTRDSPPPFGILKAYLLDNRRFDMSSDEDSKDISSARDTPQTKHFYKFKVFPKKFFKIYFDRLALLALLDRNLSVIENLIAVIMSVMVGALGALVLAGNFYYDFWIFVFCFIMAGCQYSLLKSVQPDAASPMHGYNHLIVFSRPFYFCFICGLMLLMDYLSSLTLGETVYVYGIPFTTTSALIFARDFLRVFLMCLPLTFTVGLLPQVNTYFMYLLEQIDTHIFGGNATVSLLSSFYCCVRSVLAAGFLYAVCYLTLVQLGKNIVDEPNPCHNTEFAQTAAFSIFCAVLVAMSHHLSRSASDHSVLWMLVKDKICGEREEIKKDDSGADLKDPLPGKLKTCVNERLQSDLLISVVIMILSFAIHVSTVFIQPLIDEILYFTVAAFGFLVHYLIPQLRKEMPWLCCSHPMWKSQERHMYEATGPAKIMWFEKLYIWTRFVERNGMYPVVILCALTRSVPAVLCKFGYYFGPLVITVCAMKLLRFAFSNTPKQHLILAFTVLFFKYDLRWASESMLVDLFFISILFVKFIDLYLKMKFVITYIAPWQITWGSAFHAFAQPFSVPHSAMLFLQAGVSALFSTPLNPFLGSAIFITSYVRPVKFWEKDYNTKRVDHSNTRLSQQLERNTGADDNNLNSIFYEHLTRSLQHSLCGDLLMGRWGNAEQGDTFIMASDSLNALVHIIEMGNGLVTFQLRGLEFRGTYCQQREVEAITEGVEENEGFCCFEPGHLPHFLSLNAAFNQRWLSWEVVVTKYVLEGYSISDNNAASMVGVFDFRKVLIMYYVQSIIYYTIRSPRLEEWLENRAILEALEPMGDESYCDVDPTFSVHVDDDYDSQNSGISRKSFCNRNLDWIQYCSSRREKAVDSRRDSTLVSLCFALSLLGRRALGTASHNNASASVEFFLYGLHALFKGDFRITSPRDEWVFADMELLRRVVSPGVRMSLKLHQDHFLISDAYETEESLYDAISHYEANLVISHEADPTWRNAVLSNTPSLLALRNVFDEGMDEYKVIMLNKRFLTFRIVKINRECVRGLWAGQQQELIFLRNRNPERGSIQNAKQALRNMINSSCDQPIGYPIYVSPLTTSYSSTNEQYTSVIGGEFIINNVKRFFKNAWQSLRRHCGASCTSGSSAFAEGDIPYSCTHQAAATVLGSGRPCPMSTPTNTPGDMTLNSMGNRGSLISTTSSAASKPRSLVTLAGLIGENPQQKDNLPQHKVKIIDVSYVYDNINLGRRIDVQWPNDEWRNNGGKNAWGGWVPTVGMEGIIVHRWSPFHREIMKRSHTDKTIVLVQIGERYVPVCDLGVQDMGPEVC